MITNIISRNISIIHQNINRLENKCFQLECELQLLHKDVDVLCITEHFLRPNELSCVRMANYKLAASYARTTREGGGACIYVRPDLLTIERREFAALSVEMHFEVCAVECVGLDLIVVCIYRPPQGENRGDIDIFFPKINSLLDLNASNNYKLILVGDINIDILSKTLPSKRLISSLKQHGFVTLVNFPTRVTSSSSTCLDHAYTNIPINDILKVTPVEMYLSDHSGFIVVAQIKGQHLNHNEVTCKRLFSQLQIDNFYEALSMYNWDNILHKWHCPSDQLNAILNVTKHLYQVYFPIRKYPVKKNLSPGPIIGLKNCDAKFAKLNLH